MRGKMMALGAGLVFLAAGFMALGAEIGFVEDFALATNRTAVLNQLIPGTEEYYFYTCLNYQNQGQYDKVEETLRLWLVRSGEGATGEDAFGDSPKRSDETARRTEIRNRQALLTYGKNPPASLEYLTRKLNLAFNHEPWRPGQIPTCPTRLDQDLISRETLTAWALDASVDTVNGFEESALDMVAAMDPDGGRRRDLLRRLQRPDCPNLVTLVAADLDDERAQPFGSYPIHRQMLLAQLDELVAMKPGLLNEENFVNTYLAKLRPGPDVDWRHDPAQRAALLDRQWAFVKKLGPAHNSLKLGILHQRLAHDRALGQYDKQRFMDYIRIPREAAYVNPKYLERPSLHDNQAKFGVDFSATALMPAVPGDEALVRDYLEHFFVKEDSYRPYQEYLLDSYLRQVLAETKILNGIGDMEKWYSLLDDPARYQAIMDRVEIEFAPVNKTSFAPEEPVALDVDIKNVKTLIVKIFEINTLNYYRDKLAPVSTAIDLDGLVAGREDVVTYDESPLRRIRRHFEFPDLNRRGVFVVEFIGNGKSSRALVQKGNFRFLERVGAAGHVFTILDEQNRKLNGTALWLGGHEYQADTNGLITVPFSTGPGRQTILISQGGFTTLASFEHQAEKYKLSAGIYVERESVLSRRKAQVLIRPVLTVNDIPISLALLEDPVLTIESTDGDGVETMKDVNDLKLSSDREAVCEFQVPENLRQMTFTLKGRIQNLSQNRKDDLKDGKTLGFNEIESTDRLEDFYLSRTPDGYVLRLLGKNGDPKPDRLVQVYLKHRDFVQQVGALLQTDAEGRIWLGPMEDIVALRIDGRESAMWNWYLPQACCALPDFIHARVGDTITVPYLGSADQPGTEELALLEKRGDTYVKDWFPALSIRDGFVEITGLPAGTFELDLKKYRYGPMILEVTEGEVRNGYVMGTNRLLEAKNPLLLQIGTLRADGDQVTIALRHATPLTRVHVVATRFLPAYRSIFDDIVVYDSVKPQAILPERAVSLYESGRDIGDEYRYILERKYARKFPGNLLTRPGLLLNPWARSLVESVMSPLVMKGMYGRSGSGGRGRALSKYGGGKAVTDRPHGPGSVEFLPEPAVVLANLRPDAKGVISIPRKALGAGQQIRVVAINPDNTVYRDLLVPEAPLVTRDLRLSGALDPKKHFTEQKQISVVPGGGELVIQDITSSKAEIYDTLRKVHGLYATLSGDVALQEFGFITIWPDLTPEEKREKYSEYACHELNFFLYKKDRDFFEKVVQPYLKHKKDKTFLDRWLIGDELSAYLRPWAYGQLNAVERILLAQRIKGETPATVRYTKDLLDRIPADLDQLNRLFLTALQGSALDTESVLVATNAVGSSVELPRQVAQATISEEKVEEPEVAPPAAVLDASEEAAGGGDDLARREKQRPLFRKLDRTEEWAENNYYHQFIEAQNRELVTVNPFWLDYARHEKGPFLSTHLTEAAGNFTEMMFALAVLDLPFEAPLVETAFQGAQLTIKGKTPLIAFHKEIKESAAARDLSPILISQNYFQANDRYREENGERFDKLVTDEFLSQVVYGCQVVLTDPASSPEKLDVLLQIPKGAIPVQNGFYTRSQPVKLDPFSTLTMEYYFYFPQAGEYSHFPVHVARKQQFLAAVPGGTLKVVDTPTRIDTTSWAHISQNGKPEEVLAFLDNDDLMRLDLERIAWRLRDKDFFVKVTELLTRRHVYNHAVWSYGLCHDVPSAIREYLQHADDFLAQCGRYLDSELVTIDPVARKTYQHLEYAPLVNARAHAVGRRRQIYDERMAAQYLALLDVLSYRPQLDSNDRLAVTYYLLLQDRVEEAQRMFAGVDPKTVTTRIQYDYLQAYMDFYTPEHKLARRIAEAYRDYPVDRWRNLFSGVLAQLDELDGKEPAVVDKKNRDQQQTQLAASETSFDLAVESRRVTVNYQNLKEAVVNYYKMDIELLFSRNPFVRQESGQFSYIRPNRSDTLQFPGNGKPLTFDLPKEFHNANVMVEIVANGVKKSQPYFANSLALQIIETYGQIKVTNQKDGAPLPQVYVKVFVRMKGGAVKFYKDGYTDLRGRFDYVSLNTDDIDEADKFALLIMSETDGAMIREASPPKQ